jgi:hypothetical protein
MKRSLLEYFAGPAPDAMTGHGYGNLEGGMTHRSAAGDKGSNWPFDDKGQYEPDEEEMQDPDEISLGDEDIAFKVLTKLSNKINRKGQGSHQWDPGAGHDRRTFASSDNMPEGIARGIKRSSSTSLTDPQDKLKPYGSSGNRGTAVGGYAPYTGTKGMTKKTGTTHGWSRKPLATDVRLDEPVYDLRSILDPDWRPVRHAEKVKDISHENEELFDDDLYLDDEEYS